MSVVFVLSTGRCGTQWLYHFLNTRLPDCWEVTHEPINFDYAPINNSPSQPLNKNPQILLNHLAYIQDKVWSHRYYVECGFPCWRHLGWFYEELNCPVKIIYLHRDPVQVSRSWLKQNAFVPPILPHLSTKELFHPAAPAAQLPHYQNAWCKLTPFEKGLYYWAEVQLQATRYKSEWPTGNWFELPFQQLTDRSVLQDLMGFLNNDVEIKSIDVTPRDKFQGIEQDAVDESLIHRHPDILREATRLGYLGSDI
ncbi:hypothetical protein [Bowmanella denitrificans]|uniref:hypothetical protein n=1 Tax=Bowmanella denitrificans TaxID=366582 RepID=UPI0011AF17EF|nr:hypothetical protein [Bowmanella denitrificans]